MRFNEGTEIVVNNTTLSDSEPTNFYQFTITGKNTSTDTIIYDINVLRGDLPNGKTESQRIADRFLKFTLQRSTDGTNYTDVITRQSYSDLQNGVRLYVDNIGTTNNVTYYYRLYAWIGREVVIYGGDDDVVGDYSDSEWPNMFATVKVKVTGDFESKTINNSLSNIIASKVSEDYVSEYSGTSNDTYDGSGNSPIYYYTGANAKANSNVLFAGYCWQIIRTTDTGGVKLLYNGVAENNQCLQNRTAKTGINGAGNLTVSGLDTTSVYGTGFTYTESGFTLTGVVSGKSWATNHDELIGMYTCKGTATTCTTLSHIGYYVNNSSARGATYTIGTVSDKYTIGRSPFNGPYESASLAGYMYNSVYPIVAGVKTGSYYGNDVTYANNKYTLTGATGTTQDAPDATHHYVCDDANCTKVRYYISLQEGVYRYITLSGGEKIADALYKQLNYKQGGTTEDINLNRYNSSMKAYLESWYAQNLNNFSTYIDSKTAYCNDRKVINVGSWSNNGILTNWWTLQFNNINAGRTDLSCPNEMDRFSTNNNKARISYPIGLITEPERALMNGAAGDGETDLYVWGLSPRHVDVDYDRVWSVAASGSAGDRNVAGAHGARPAVTLASNASFAEGDGSYASPYVVGSKVTRTIS